MGVASLGARMLISQLRIGAHTPNKKLFWRSPSIYPAFQACRVRQYNHVHRPAHPPSKAAKGRTQPTADLGRLSAILPPVCPCPSSNSTGSALSCSAWSSSASFTLSCPLAAVPARSQQPRLPAVRNSLSRLAEPRRFSTASTMVATKLDGTAIARSIRQRLAAEIAQKQTLNPRFKPSLKILQGASCFATVLSRVKYFS